MHNSSGATVSLTFTTETTPILQELIKGLGKTYRQLINTKQGYIKEESSYELEEDIS
ncbi:hypothetical protein RIVM261_079820 [Rivularia sp. IAM M-261]|nr:hypothetical protein RIVM261_079820 [Rivularia sp. IAM M-261]